MKAYLSIFVFVIFNLVNNSNAQFNQVGPYGGWINSITSDNQGRILAATFLGGIFRSSDNGQIWEEIYNDTLKADFRSVVVNESGHIFAGTDGFGLLRSTDDGVTWERLMNAFSSSTITALAAKAGRLFIGSFDGLFYSDDEGNSINSVNGISTSIDIYTVAVNSNGDLFTGTYYNGAFRSTDNGANWTEINNGLTFNNSIISGFAFNSSGNIITTSGAKVYLSSDDGDNWNDLNAPAGPNVVYVDVAIGTNDNILAAQLGQIIRSTDSGGNWTNLTQNLPSVQNLFSFNGNVFAGTAGVGVFNSTDDGDTWNLDITGMTDTHVNAIAGGPNGEIYATTKYAGLFYSSDDGDTWENRTNNLPANWLTTLAVNPQTGTVFVAIPNNYCYRSTDMGTTWEQMTTLGTNTVVTFEFNSVGEIYTGYFNRFYKSTDDGVTWILKYLTDTDSPISNIAVGLSDYVYLATDGQGVFLSTDGGDNWNPFNNGLTELNIKFIEARSDTSSLQKRNGSCNTIICATESKIFGSDGNTWNLSLTSERIIGLFLIKKITANIDDPFIAQAIESIYIQNPACAWDLILEEWRQEEMSAFYEFFVTAEKKDLIGTNGGGIYKGTATSGIKLTHNLIPDNFSLEQNYPNPFNPSTTIQFALPKESFTMLEIFNTLGEKVSTLVSENLSAGSYKYEWNASLLPSGVYFYRLSTEKFKQTKKLMLMK